MTSAKILENSRPRRYFAGQGASSQFTEVAFRLMPFLPVFFDNQN